MKPIYHSKYIENPDIIFNHLLNDLIWLEATPARKEYFMANDKISYIYGSGINAREYFSESFSEPIRQIMNKLNENNNYNVCFLNRYDEAKHALNWHADDSPEMNKEHDIAVISFGAEREIYWKQKDFKGEIPKENKQLLHNGSLFIMPAGFQENHFHKIPKCDRACSARISLTFRNYIEVK